MSNDVRTRGVIPPEHRGDRAHRWVLDEWLTFLRQHRGLEPATVDRYRRYVEPFLQDLAEEARRDRFAELPPTRVREYLERNTPRLARVVEGDDTWRPRWPVILEY